MKYDVQFTNQFKKDLKLAKKQNRNLDKLFDVVDILANGGMLDAKYRNHELTGIIIKAPGNATLSRTGC